MKLLIINGPNLNLLGKREPEIYGNKGFEQYLEELKSRFPTVELAYFQSNHEGEIVDQLHGSDGTYDGIVLNAAALTHTSIAIGDAIKAVELPVVEVHISNVHNRESFRHHSYVSAGAAGIIVGFGIKGYDLAIQSFLS